MTRLVLTMLAAPPGAPLVSREATGALSIGRGPGNDWVLEDRGLPLPILSRWHCTLHPDPQGWRVEDASGNGTFLNDETAPIGKGMSRMLHSGDLLRLGDYVVQAYWAPAPSMQMVGQPADTSASPFRVGGGLALPPDFGMWPGAEAVLTPDLGPPMQEHWSAPPAIGTLPPDWDQPAERVHQAMTPPGAPGHLLPDDWDQVDAGIPTALPAAVEARPPSLPRPEHATVPSPVQDQSDGLVVLAAFLRGAGMDGPPAPGLAADPETAMLANGATFRALTGGVRTVLRSRAAIKREFRITQTLIQADGGNPLKLAPSDADAVRALATEVRPGQAAAAATEALREVAMHELAMLAAMREAARRMLLSVGPDRVQASTSGLDAVLPAARKARAFDAYAALHARTLQALDDDFDSTFGREFARAYERFIDEMQAADPTPDPLPGPGPAVADPLPKEPM